MGSVCKCVPVEQREVCRDLWHRGQENKGGVREDPRAPGPSWPPRVMAERSPGLQLLPEG